MKNKQQTPQRNLRRFALWGGLEKERFVLRGGTLRFVFSERFVLRIIDERYFKINKNKNIVLTDFYVDEFKITFKGKRFYRINNKGKFIFIRKEKSL